jgi:hypothetical protein
VALRLPARPVAGLRRSCVLSGSSEGDSEDGEWSAWVAGMVAKRGGEVDWPGPAERADGQVAQGRHDVWAGAGPDLGGVLGERHVPDVGSPFSIAQCPQMRSASRAGLAWAWARLVTASTTTVRHRRLRSSRTLRVTWMTCAVCGNPNLRTETVLRVRSSTRSCARSRVRSSTGTLCQARRWQRPSSVGWWP